MTNAYGELAIKIYLDLQLVKQRYDAKAAYVKSRQDDREKALCPCNLAKARLRTIYQCDHKCVSYWQQLPVPLSGREVNADMKVSAIHAP